MQNHLWFCLRASAREKLEIVRIGLLAGGGWRAEISSRRQKLRSDFFKYTPHANFSD